MIALLHLLEYQWRLGRFDKQTASTPFSIELRHAQWTGSSTDCCVKWKMPENTAGKSASGWVESTVQNIVPKKHSKIKWEAQFHHLGKLWFFILSPTCLYKFQQLGFNTKMFNFHNTWCGVYLWWHRSQVHFELIQTLGPAVTLYPMCLYIFEFWLWLRKNQHSEISGLDVFIFSRIHYKSARVNVFETNDQALSTSLFYKEIKFNK